MSSGGSDEAVSGRPQRRGRKRRVGEADLEGSEDGHNPCDSHPHLFRTASAVASFPIPNKVCLNEDEIRVGRLPSANQMVLDSKKVPNMISRRHAAVVREPAAATTSTGDADGDDSTVGADDSTVAADSVALMTEGADASADGFVWRIRDLGSVNGVFVNNVKIEGHVDLRHGSVITFGGGGKAAFGATVVQSDSEFIYEFHQPADASNKRAKLADLDTPSKAVLAEAEANLKAELAKKEAELAALTEEQEALRAAEVERLKAEREAGEKEAEERLRVELARKAAEMEELEQQVKDLNEARLAAAEQQKELQKDNQCPICVDTVLHPATPNGCGHMACHFCLVSVMYLAEPRCPYCRQEFTDINRLYGLDGMILQSVAGSSEADEYTERVEAVKKEERKIEKLKKSVTKAQREGKEFLNIQMTWNDQDKDIFHAGVDEYTGFARIEYCKLTGLTRELVLHAPRQKLRTIASNLRLNAGSTRSNKDLKSNIVRFIIRDPV